MNQARQQTMIKINSEAITYQPDMREQQPEQKKDEAEKT